MRGYEEELLYDASLEASQLVTALLYACLVQLGSLPEVSPAVIVQLYTADRNYLLLELRRITLGDRLHASYTCPGCQNVVELVEDLGQMEVHWLAEGQPLKDIQLTLADGYVDKEGKLHNTLTLTLPRGVDEGFVTPMIKRDPLKARDA